MVKFCYTNQLYKKKVHKSNNMLSFLTSLKYRIFGRYMKSQTRVRMFEENLNEMLRNEKLVKSLTLKEITVKSDVNLKQKQELTDMAYFTAKEYSFLNNPESLSTLRDIYDRYKILERESKILKLLRHILNRKENIHNANILDIMLEQQLLTENYKNKIDQFSRPSHNSLSKIATKLQIKKDIAGDMRKEINSILDDCSDDEGENEDEDKFQNWLQNLTSTQNNAENVHTNIENEFQIEHRLNKLKNN